MFLLFPWHVDQIQMYHDDFWPDLDPDPDPTYGSGSGSLIIKKE